MLVPLGDVELPVEACIFQNTANMVRHLQLEQRAKYFSEDTGEQVGGPGVTGVSERPVVRPVFRVHFQAQ